MVETKSVAPEVVKSSDSFPAEIPKTVEVPKEYVLPTVAEPVVEKPATPMVKIDIFNPTSGQTKVSAHSLSSIKAKKELEASQKTIVKEVVHLPSEIFTETEMLEQWYKYAQRLNDKGHLIMESLLNIEDPKLDGTKIIHELPNEGSKIDFDKEKPELLGYLRGKLHNHEITIEVKVNESMPSKKAFTAQDKYNRLNEINPNLELLKKMFDLDI